MARSELNTVSYFPLYCDEGQKMFYIEETYGNDGFSTFIKILRELAKTEYHYLDLSKPTSIMFLSAKCKVNKETLTSIIKDLVELGKFDKELWEKASIIWCQDFINSIQDAYKKRNNDCIERNSLLELLYSKGILIRPKVTPKQAKDSSKGDGNPQIKEEYIKEEESKVKDSPYGDGRLHFLCLEFAKSNPNKYPKEFYKNFLEYWTAPIQKNGKDFGKENWITQKTFALSLRLSTSYKLAWVDSFNDAPKQVLSTRPEQKVLELTEEEKIAFRIKNGLHEKVE